MPSGKDCPVAPVGSSSKSVVIVDGPSPSEREAAAQLNPVVGSQNPLAYSGYKSSSLRQVVSICVGGAVQRVVIGGGGMVQKKRRCGFNRDVD